MLDDPLPAPGTAALTVREALGLQPIAYGEPRLLTLSARTDRPIRWVHIIGQERPATMLQGGELVLSTLPRLREDRGDLVDALHGYLEDLDRVGAAALAVEILPDRPRLLEAMHQVAADREAQPGAAELVPLMQFGRVVRFVEITEALHRELVSRQLGYSGGPRPAWDPIVSATTNLFDDLVAPGGLPGEETAARARALGMPAGARFTPLVFRTRGAQGPADTARRQAPSLAALVRTAATQLKFPALVGAGAPGEIWVLLAHGDAQKLCAAVRQAVVRRRTQELIPRYTAAAGQGVIALEDAPKTLATTAKIAASAARLVERSPERANSTAAARTGYWTAADLGLPGLLVHLSDTDDADWFLRHHLAAFRGPDGEHLQELVAAAIATGGNKAELARRLGVSRPTLYSRITKLERAVGRGLDGETLATLHVALTLDALR